MSDITIFGGEKGGPGKTTLATNVAAAIAHTGHSVLLLNVDPMASSVAWGARREEAHPELPRVTVTSAPGDVYHIVRDLAQRYDYIIVDAAGVRAASDKRTTAKEYLSALKAATRVVIPVRPSQVDLDTLENAVETIESVRSLHNSELAAYVLISQAPTNPLQREVRDARAFIGEFAEFQLLPGVIGERKVYRDAMIDGLGVVEMRNSTAKAEIQLLVQALYDL